MLSFIVLYVYVISGGFYIVIITFFKKFYKENRPYLQGHNINPTEA